MPFDTMKELVLSGVYAMKEGRTPLLGSPLQPLLTRAWARLSLPGR